MVMLGISACSDNVDGELKPTSNERVLQLSSEGQTTSDNGRDHAITFDNLDAGSRDIPVTVSCNTLWKVEVSGNSGWCSVDVARGEGNGQFTISITNNRGEFRDCTVSVSQIDNEGNTYKGGNTAEIVITQDGSEVYITPSSLDIFPAENPRDQEFEIVANTTWTLSVRAESELTGNFITITPIEGMTEAAGGNQTFTGTGNARFRISLQNNGTAVVRKAYIELKSENGNYSVEISQQKSEYTFDVSPNTTRYIPALGGDIDFDVYSPSYGWDIILPENAGWIKCPQTSFEKNESRVKAVMTVEQNNTGRERNATIYFESQNKAYDRIPVMVVQSGYDLTFAISSQDASEVVMENGGSLSFDLDSRFNWIIETPTWVSASETSGDGSASARRISLKVEPNSTNSNRTGTVTVIPQTTTFDGEITLNPKEIGIESLRFSVTQFGGREAAVSVPWLLDGYTQTSATVEFNYYSPFARIVEAGLQWKKENDADWNTSTVAVSNPTDGTVTVDLTGLDAATKYVARGYVKDENGSIKYGTVSYPFTTAGKFPGSGDNPTPNK